MERYETVAGARAASPAPQHLAGGEQFVEHARLVVAHAWGEDQRLPRREGQRGAVELFDDGKQPIDPVLLIVVAEALPRREEAAKCCGFDRFDGCAEFGQAALADAT